jgi:hypothetical protein
LAAVAAAALGAGAWAALPAGAANQTVQLNSTTAALDVATSPAAPAPSTNLPPAKCEAEEWPDAATGQPAGFQAGAATGFYLWHNDEGWHLEATHPTQDHVVFSGWFSSNGSIAFQRVDDEKNDITKQGPGDHTLAFAFNNYGRLDGVHFVTHCADHLVFHLFINGRPSGIEQINVGHAPVHPRANPFTVDRMGVH